MKKFIIKYNYGYGEEIEVVDAEDELEAKNIAYEYWKAGAENEAVYGVIGEATKELLEEHL